MPNDTFTHNRCTHTITIFLLTMVIMTGANTAFPLELDKATQQVYLKNLDKPEFFDLYAITDVYLQEPGSASAIRLTNTPASEEYPSLSSDRTQLVFCQGGLYLLDLESRRYQELVGGEFYCRESQWIPGSVRISFTGDTTGQRQFSEDRDVYVVDSVSKKIQNVTNTPDINEFGHDWSPDGKRLASIEGDTGRNRRCRVWVQSERDSSEPFVAGEFSTAVTKLAWNSEGSKIYCAIRESEFVRGLASIDIASGEVAYTQVVNLDSHNWDIARTGSKFVNSRRKEKFKVVGVDTLFSEHVEVIGMSPSWCNDGSAVVFTKVAFPFC